MAKITVGLVGIGKLGSPMAPHVAEAGTPVYVFERDRSAADAPARAARALPGQIEPFDRDDFAPRLGALRMAMRGIGKDGQRCLGAKAPGLRWGSSSEACLHTTAPRVRCGRRADARCA